MGQKPPRRVYAVPAFYRVLSWGFAAVCAVGFLACLTVPFFTTGAFDYLYLAFVGAFLADELALLLASEALRLRERFAVTPEGLLRIGQGDRYDFLRWDVIVRSHERPLLQRLDVVNRESRVFRLEYQLEGFGELTNELAVRAPTAWRDGVGEEVSTATRARQATVAAGPTKVRSATSAALDFADCAGADRAATSLETPPEEWWLVAAVRVGSVDGPDALTRIGAFLALPGGGAWFSQPMEQLVRIVDADGRLARGVGRRGQGPGEFTAIGPLGLWRGSPDTIWVMDWMPRRLSLFTADGAFVRTVPMPDVSWGDR